MEGVSLNKVREKVSELVRNRLSQQVTLDSGGTTLLRVHDKQIRDIQVKEIQEKVFGTPLVEIALCYRLEEI